MKAAVPALLSLDNPVFHAYVLAILKLTLQPWMTVVRMGYLHGLPGGLSIITDAWQDRQALNISYAFKQLEPARSAPSYRPGIP